ncbi:MAG TPA: VWA domain-containing protein [Bacteroidia bacterium]|nr:VWA domain-containing protein [Bacteroidia bacterium]
MNDLTFAQPAWFWGSVVLLPLLVLRVWSHLHAARQLPGLVSPRLAHRLVNGASHARRWTVFVLQTLAIAALLAALARPQWGVEEVETEIEARNLLIAIDTSRSMMSDDLPPNRLSRAKLAAKDIILSLPDDRVGLIAFAGKPFLQAPFTVDHEAVIEAVDQLDTEIIPRGGSNLSAAVKLALDTVKEAKLGQSALVLFSDGEALEGTDELEKARDEAGALGLTILTVGVGTPEGSIIPEVDENDHPIPGAFVKDENGQVVRTRLMPEALQTLASKGGTYLHLGGPVSLARVVDEIRSNLAASREESETSRRPIERFLWPLGASTALLALSFLVPLFWLKPRRAMRGAVALLLGLGYVGNASAKDPLAGGHAAYDQQDYAGALAAYEQSLGEARSPREQSRLQMGIGAAAYRLSDYERAAEAYGQALANGDGRLRQEALYNLGNTLFRRGEAVGKPEQTLSEWESAVEHYESALDLDPDNARTAHNLEYVKKRIEELKRQQEEQKKKEEEEQKKEEEKEDEKEEEKEDKQDQKDQDQKEKDQQKDQNQKDQNQDPQKDDQQQDGDGQGSPPPPGQDQKDPNQNGKPGEDDKGKQDPPQPPQDPGENPGKEQTPPSDQSDPSGQPNQPDPPKPNPGNTPPPEPDTPKDGDLEANPDQAQPQRPQESGAASPANAQPDPQTGYTPSKARQLLDALADETEVRPFIAPPAPGEKFKNW